MQGLTVRTNDSKGKSLPAASQFENTQEAFNKAKRLWNQLDKSTRLEDSERVANPTA